MTREASPRENPLPLEGVHRQLCKLFHSPPSVAYKSHTFFILQTFGSSSVVSRLGSAKIYDPLYDPLKST